MRISTTRLQYDFPAPGTRRATAEASQRHSVTASSDVSGGRRHDGGAAHWSRPPVVRVVEGALVEKAPNSDTAWSAVRRMTALRGRIIPAPGGQQSGEDVRSRSAISAYARAGSTDSQGSLLNRYA